MTQILSLITEDYALMASDRRLSRCLPDGTLEFKDDDACKLVSVYNLFGIGYTGLAEIAGVPTYKWIAKTIAQECRDPGLTAKVLEAKAEEAVKPYRASQRRLMFILAGFGYFKDMEGLHSFICKVGNFTDQRGHPLDDVASIFASRIYRLKGAPVILFVAGAPIPLDRKNQLRRNMSQFVARKIGPKAALRLLIDEIILTSDRLKPKHGESTVSKKILAMCIPRLGVEELIRTGGGTVILRKGA